MDHLVLDPSYATADLCSRGQIWKANPHCAYQVLLPFPLQTLFGWAVAVGKQL